MSSEPVWSGTSCLQIFMNIVFRGLVRRLLLSRQVWVSFDLWSLLNMPSNRISSSIMLQGSLRSTASCSLPLCKLLCTVIHASCSLILRTHWLPTCLGIPWWSLQPLHLPLSITVSSSISVLGHSIGLADAISVHVLVVNILGLSLLPFKFSCLLNLITRHEYFPYLRFCGFFLFYRYNHW